MFECIPPRREPRLLLFERHGTKARYVAIDPFDLRGIGTTTLSKFAIHRLLHTLRPTVILATSVMPMLARVARTRGLPIVRVGATRTTELRAQAPTTAAIQRMFPVTRLLRTSAERRLVRFAVSFLLSRNQFPARLYASTLSARSLANKNS